MDSLSMMWRPYNFLFILITLLPACSSSTSSSNNDPAPAPVPTPPSPAPAPAPVVDDWTNPYALNYQPNQEYLFSDTVDQDPHYFKFSGLKPGLDYSISFTGISKPMHIEVFTDKNYDSKTDCLAYFRANDWRCIYTADSDGALYVKTRKLPFGSSHYTLGVRLAAEEGTDTEPMHLVTVPYQGSISGGMSNSSFDVGKSSYFMISDLIPGNGYVVSFTQLSGNVEVFLYQHQFETEACWLLIPVTGVTEACAFTATNSEIYFRIRAENHFIADAAGSYQIESFEDQGLAQIFYPQGSIGNEVMLTLDIPTDSEVDKTASYYQIHGLEPTKTYITRLTKAIRSRDRLGLTVYTDAGYNHVACAETTISTKAAECHIAVNSSGQLWIKVDGNKANQFLGAEYQLLVTELISPAVH